MRGHMTGILTLGCHLGGCGGNDQFVNGSPGRGRLLATMPSVLSPLPSVFSAAQ
jgi:hypothetical protein